jgi:hypothetical protein
MMSIISGTHGKEFPTATLATVQLEFPNNKFKKKEEIKARHAKDIIQSPSPSSLSSCTAAQQY